MDDAGAGHVIRWWVPLGILVIGLAGGAVLGAATNVVNGSVSGEYFSIVMGWNSIEAPFLAIPQGMLEGGGLGAGFGIVVAISFAASTKLRGRSDLALRAWASRCWWRWFVGGLAAGAELRSHLAHRIFFMRCFLSRARRWNWCDMRGLAVRSGAGMAGRSSGALWLAFTCMSDGDGNAGEQMGRLRCCKRRGEARVFDNRRGGFRIRPWTFFALDRLRFAIGFSSGRGNIRVMT
jgi:hypothetical protein